jgi:predicted nucleic acid-binding protein
VTAKAFLDTSYLVALAIATDLYHTRARDYARRVREAGTRLVTTRAVLLELGNALSKLRFRAAAGQLLAAFDSDPSVTVVSLTDPLYHKALALFRNRPDKEWGLIDCVSFVVMAEHGLTEALTADEHFEQAGFVALLRRGPS